ncbi:MAG: hypothetical protein JJ992_09965, partial [Planctomycetes bacterium]|nr:hypothetical protein [Planctomycetota bacterium]
MMEPNGKGVWSLLLLLLLLGTACQHSARRSRPTWATPDRSWPVVPVGYQTETLAEAESVTQPSEAAEPGQNAPPSSTAAETLPAPDPQPPLESTSGPLSLDEVVRSVYVSFPLLQVELQQRQVADGEAISAWGPYDLNVEAYGIAAPEGYYENYRNGVAVKQALYPGGYVYSGYRIGRGL